MAPFSDGPAAMAPARLRTLQGRGILEKVDHPDSNPFVSTLLWLVMSVSGTGLWQGRILFVLAGSASCSLLFFLMRRTFGDRTSAVAGLMLAVNFTFIQYNRLALEETLVIFFGLAALVIVRIEEPTQLRAAIAGLFLGIAIILVKLHALVFVPGFALAAIRSHRVRKEETPSPLWDFFFVLGLLAVLLFGWLLGLKPVYAQLSQYFFGPEVSAAADPHGFSRDGISGVISGLSTNFFLRMPLICLLGWIGFMWLSHQAVRIRPDINENKNLIMSWFAWTLIGLFILHYRPLRYYILLIPPLCAFAAVALGRIAHPLQETSHHYELGSRVILIIGFSIGFCFLGQFVATGVNQPLRIPFLEPIIFLVSLILGFAVGCYWLKAVAVIARFWNGKFARFRKGFYWLLVCACLGIQVVPMVEYHRSATWNTFHASHDLEIILHSDAVIAGPLADAATAENKLRSCPHSGVSGKLEGLFKECPDATHLLLPMGKDWEGLQEAREEGRLIPIRRYIIGPFLDWDAVGKLTTWCSIAQQEKELQILFRISMTKSAPPTEYELGVLALRNEDEAAARSSFEYFLKSHPGHVPSLIQLARWDRKSLGRLKPGTVNERNCNLWDIRMFTSVKFSGKLDGPIP